MQEMLELEKQRMPSVSIDAIDKFEIRNSVEDSRLQTDEDANFKRSILQMIYNDDLAGLQSLLQIHPNGENGS